MVLVVPGKLHVIPGENRCLEPTGRPETEKPRPGSGRGFGIGVGDLSGGGLAHLVYRFRTVNDSVQSDSHVADVRHTVDAEHDLQHYAFEH